MRILYLLFPFLLLLVQGAEGASLAPGNEDECKREGGFCGFLTCYHPDHIFGRCSVFMVCCKSNSLQVLITEEVSERLEEDIAGT
ncbi:antimicrobial peptide THP1-like [Opisthocomus hoazin]|uniref:antimicrobial peptide THP1-like n=1 Tax=Opisthocomus hoazin TaxID=30419 RepID=UPI003F52AB81